MSVPSSSTSPLVSVVIPTANRANLLVAAVQSVLAQSYGNLELIVVDDASTDETERVMAGFGDKLLYLRQREKQGGSAARNVGIAAAQGKYVAFLDDDDEWLPEKIALQVEAAQQPLDGRTPVVYTGEVWVSRSGQEVRVQRPTREGWLLKDLLFGNYVGSTSTVLASKEALDAVGGFDVTLPSCQDWDLWVRLAVDSPFRVLPAPLVRRGIEGERINSNLAAQVDGRQRFLQKIEPHLAKQSWYFQRRARCNHFMLIAGRCAANQRRQEAVLWSRRACLQDPLNPRAWVLLGRILAGR